MFFYDLNDIKEYAVLNASFEMHLLTPKLLSLDRDILKLHFGADFVDEIQDNYNSTTNGDISTLPLATQKIIKKFREITGPLSVALHVSSGQIEIDNSGIFINRTDTRWAASEWQIRDLMKAYLKPGYQAIEDTILFLQSNITDYATYANSEEFDYFKTCFVPTSKEFTKYYSPLNYSFMSFLKLRSVMDKIEEQVIQGILLKDYFNEFKTKLKADTLGVADKAILPYIRKVVVNLTAEKALSELNATFDENGFMTFDNTAGQKTGKSKKTAVGEVVVRAQESLRDSGNAYANTLKKFLEDNKVSYPTYANDPTYQADQSAVFKNEQGQNYFAAL